MRNFKNFPIQFYSYLWLIYIATLVLCGNRIMSSVGSHSCHFSLADSRVADWIDSTSYQRTMALAIEIYSYFLYHKLMQKYVERLLYRFMLWTRLMASLFGNLSAKIEKEESLLVSLKSLFTRPHK